MGLLHNEKLQIDLASFINQFNAQSFFNKKQILLIVSDKTDVRVFDG